MTTLEKIANSRTRADVVPIYADEIRRHFRRERHELPPDWNAINMAILSRWSESALIFIKREAWKKADARGRE